MKAKEAKEKASQVNFNEYKHQYSIIISSILEASNKGYCIMVDKKQYFEIETTSNPNIYQSNNISDIILYCV